MKYLFTVKKLGDTTPPSPADVIPDVIVEADGRQQALERFPIHIGQMYRAGEVFDAYALDTVTLEMASVAKWPPKGVVRYQGELYIFRLAGESISITQRVDGAESLVGSFRWDGRQIHEEGEPVLLPTDEQDDAESFFRYGKLEKPVTIFFEDCGQDFSEWDISADGLVLTSRPFQHSVWSGHLVKGLKVGKEPTIGGRGQEPMVLKYKVVRIVETAARRKELVDELIRTFEAAAKQDRKIDKIRLGQAFAHLRQYTSEGVLAAKRRYLGAPGDWGYGTPHGQAWLKVLQVF